MFQVDAYKIHQPGPDIGTKSSGNLEVFLKDGGGGWKVEEVSSFVIKDWRIYCFQVLK